MVHTKPQVKNRFFCRKCQLPFNLPPSLCNVANAFSCKKDLKLAWNCNQIWDYKIIPPKQWPLVDKFFTKIHCLKVHLSVRFDATTLSITTFTILTLRIMTLSIMILSIMMLSILTLTIMTLSIKTLSITTLNKTFMICVVSSLFFSLAYAKCNYADSLMSKCL